MNHWNTKANSSPNSAGTSGFPSLMLGDSLRNLPALARCCPAYQLHLLPKTEPGDQKKTLPGNARKIWATLGISPLCAKGFWNVERKVVPGNSSKLRKLIPRWSIWDNVPWQMDMPTVEKLCTEEALPQMSVLSVPLLHFHDS